MDDAATEDRWNHTAMIIAQIAGPLGNNVTFKEIHPHL